MHDFLGQTWCPSRWKYIPPWDIEPIRPIEMISFILKRMLV